MDLNIGVWSEDGDPDGTDGLPDKNLLDFLIFDKTYTDLDALNTDAANIPEIFRALYILQTLTSLPDDSLNRYNDMVNNPYDWKFNKYSHAIADRADLTMHN